MTDKAMPELKPCPLPGCKDNRITRGYEDGPMLFRVQCVSTEHVLKVYGYTQEIADERWNTRPHQEALDQVRVDDLAQEIRRVDGQNNLGAGALAEALIPFIRLTSQEDIGVLLGQVQAGWDKNDHSFHFDEGIWSFRLFHPEKERAWLEGKGPTPAAAIKAALVNEKGGGV